MGVSETHICFVIKGLKKSTTDAPLNALQMNPSHT